jgi:hypothetical protein
LQAVTLGQQGDVFGREVGNQRVKAFPEGSAFDANPWQDLFFDELVKRGGDLKAVAGGAGSGHKFLLGLMQRRG